jgi:AraC-like DNA-binding protein
VACTSNFRRGAWARNCTAPTAEQPLRCGDPICWKCPAFLHRSHRGSDFRCQGKYTLPALQNTHHHENIPPMTIPRLQRIQDWSRRAHEAKYSVASLARGCGVSKRSLERFFVSAIGEPPCSWLRRMRMSRAVEFLRQGFSVKETADLLGYKYSTYFSRAFKQEAGAPPRGYVGASIGKPRRDAKCRAII